MWKILEQVRAEWKQKNKDSTEEDFSIRADDSNQESRWRLTITLIMVYFGRVILFGHGYCFLTSVLLFECKRQVHGLLFPPGGMTFEYTASDGLVRTTFKNGVPIRFGEPLVEYHFKSKLSHDEFAALVRRIIEFKIWYMTTVRFLIAFLLSWVPFLNFSFYGIASLVIFVAWDYSELVDVAHEFKKRARLGSESNVDGILS